MADEKKKRAEDEDEIDPDAAPPPAEFEPPKGLFKVKPDADAAVKSGAATGKPPPLVPGGTPSRSAKDEEVDPDAAPPPKEFQPPKGLLRMKPEPQEFAVKSGASAPPTLPPAPPPPGADIRMDKPVGGPKPHVPTADDLGTPDIRFQKGLGGPKPYLPNPEDFGTPEIQMQRGAPKLPKIEPPGPFDVIKQGASPEPRPQEVRLPTPLEGDVEVKDYRRTGPVELEGMPDVFGTRRRIGVVDTTFARFNMGDAAEDQLKKLGGDLEVIRRTVPGIKDLAVECKILFDKSGCDVVVACGMVGAMPVDKTCAHEASLAIQWTQLAVNKHVLEVFVHEDEAKDERQLASLMERRTREHAENAWAMVFEPDRLRKNAGKGLRQGFEDAGPIPLA